jgi:hypothetical protein
VALILSTSTPSSVAPRRSTSCSTPVASGSSAAVPDRGVDRHRVHRHPAARRRFGLQQRRRNAPWRPRRRRYGSGALGRGRSGASERRRGARPWPGAARRPARAVRSPR